MVLLLLSSLRKYGSMRKKHAPLADAPANDQLKRLWSRAQRSTDDLEAAAPAQSPAAVTPAPDKLLASAADESDESDDSKVGGAQDDSEARRPRCWPFGSDPNHHVARIVNAAATTNYLDPDTNTRMYQDCGTVIVVSGLLITASYSALITGYSKDTGNTMIEDRQLAWFCVLNHWSFCLSVVAVFAAVAGSILLQEFDTWPAGWDVLPVMPANDVPEAASDSHPYYTLTLRESYARALNFIRHANRYGLVSATMSNMIRSVFVATWTLLLCAMLLTLGAGCIALQKHITTNNSSTGFFWHSSVLPSGIALVVSVIGLFLAFVFRRDAVKSTNALGGNLYMVGPRKREKMFRRAVLEYMILSKEHLHAYMWIAALRLANDDIDDEVRRLSVLPHLVRA
jgi:hypothetical protein